MEGGHSALAWFVRYTTFVLNARARTRTRELEGRGPVCVACRLLAQPYLR
jgi:hypothetical protein